MYRMRECDIKVSPTERTSNECADGVSAASQHAVFLPSDVCRAE